MAKRWLQSADLDAVSELDARLSDDQWIARVKANTARWENVSGYNIIRDRLRTEMLLKLAPVVVGILAALVGL
jgi:hypothetical protein